MTDKYHIIREKESPRIMIETNKPYYGLRNGVNGHTQSKAPSFNKYSPRKPIICSDAKGHSVDLNASRFEPINKDPIVLSTVKRPTGVVFEAHNRRNDLFPIMDQTTFYDYSKDKIMGRLTRGYSNFRTQKSRDSPAGLGLKIEPEDSYDYRNAVEAHTTKTKPKTVALTNFKKQ